MTDKQTPPDWVLIEAAKRFGWGEKFSVRDLREEYKYTTPYRALCDMIEKYEQPPVDRKVLCAREAIETARKASTGWSEQDRIVYAIELFEQGFGK